MIHTRSLTKDFVVSKTTPCMRSGASPWTSNPVNWWPCSVPNGAGKSTTMRMLTTLIAAHRRYRDCRRPRHCRRIGAGPAADRVRRPGQRCRSQPARRRRTVQPGPDLRLGPAVRKAKGSGIARCTRPDRARLPQGLEPVRRTTPTAGRRHGPGALTVVAVPRRAIHRARSAEPGEPVGAHPADANERHFADDDHADHPLPG